MLGLSFKLSLLEFIHLWIMKVRMLWRYLLQFFIIPWFSSLSFLCSKAEAKRQPVFFRKRPPKIGRWFRETEESYCSLSEQKLPDCFLDVLQVMMDDDTVTLFSLVFYKSYALLTGFSICAKNEHFWNQFF